MRQYRPQICNGTILYKTENILLQYSLPSIDKFLTILPTKIKWKQTVRYAINTFWSNKFRLRREKSILIRLYTVTINIGETQPFWETATEITGNTKKATRTARILTGTYILQATKANFNIESTDPICIVRFANFRKKTFNIVLLDVHLWKGSEGLLLPCKTGCFHKIGFDQWKNIFQNRKTLSQLSVDCRK